MPRYKLFTRSIKVNLDEELYKEIKEIAIDDRKTINELVREAIIQYIKARKETLRDKNAGRHV